MFFSDRVRVLHEPIFIKADLILTPVFKMTFFVFIS
jgi:hypothetical protein